MRAACCQRGPELPARRDPGHDVSTVFVKGLPVGHPRGGPAGTRSNDQPARAGSEPFSSCVCLADVQYVDGLGELSGAPGAAAELAEYVPGLELVCWAFARSPGDRSCAWALLACFRDSGLFFPLYGIFAYVLPW